MKRRVVQRIYSRGRIWDDPNPEALKVMQELGLVGYYGKYETNDYEFHLYGRKTDGNYFEPGMAREFGRMMRRDQHLLETRIDR